MKYIDIIKCVDATIPLIDKSFDFLSNIKSLVVCGNGFNGYVENESNIAIDAHDFVVRINNFTTIPKFTGLKKNCLFAGASAIKHLDANSFYPELNFDHIVTSVPVYSRISKYKDLKKYNPNIIYYNQNKIQENLNKLGYKSKNGISGLHCIVLFMAIYKKMCITKFSIVGFSTAKYYNLEKVSYYYGDVDISKDNGHHEHDWDFQYAFINTLTKYHGLLKNEF